MRSIPATGVLAAVTLIPVFVGADCLAGPDFYGTGDPLGH